MRRMRSQNYYYQTAIGIARIGVSNTNANCYALWIGDCLIEDQFDSPEDAAAKAHRKDFSSNSAMQSFHGAYVPEDINLWRQTPPEKQKWEHAPPDSTVEKCRVPRSFSIRPAPYTRN